MIGLASDTAVLFILATGVTFVIMLGGIDLSIQSMASLASVIVALTIPRLGYGSFLVAIAIGAIAGLLSGIVHVRLKIPSFIADARDGRRPFQRGVGDFKGTVNHPRRSGAGLSGLDHRPGVRLAERYFDRAHRPGGGAHAAGAHAVRPLQRSDWSRRACGLRIRRQGRPAEDLLPSFFRRRSRRWRGSCLRAALQADRPLWRQSSCCLRSRPSLLGGPQ